MKDFLPLLQEANSNLEEKLKSDKSGREAEQVNIEHIDDEQEKVVEMVC